MTTYKFYKNQIIVTFDDSKDVLFSDSQMSVILSHLSLDFITYYGSLSVLESKFLHASNMIENMRQLCGLFDTEFIIHMLHEFLRVVHRVKYPDFRIIFVNEI